MQTSAWWQGPLRVIQDNLQVMDTPLMDPETIARETEEMHANVLVVNVGGIYAWYASHVKYHHVNEYLPKGRDLLQELLDACHKRDIKLVARFDFSKTDDWVMQEKPEWFVREPNGAPRSYGASRPGNWSILYATCINAGYRYEGVAIPVLNEVLDRYNIDGIFLNAPNYEYCCCEACQEKYKRLYGKELPMDASGSNAESTFGHKEAVAEMDPSFSGICYRDNIAALYKTIKDKAPDLPLILYYGIYNEHLEDRLATCDMLCTEAQNVLSRGNKNIPPFWEPTLIMKMGRAMPGRTIAPFGIIHSCPGMDWRHTGLPPAEYRPWLSQIPAAGGYIWHSITGFNQTVTDKRILDAATEVDFSIAKIEDSMHGAKEASDALLLWNDRLTDGWATLLVGTQTQFDIVNPQQVSEAVLGAYPLVILPNGYPVTPALVALLTQYVEDGGNLVIEACTAKQLKVLTGLAGVSDDMRTSEALTAAYWQFEKAGDGLRKGFVQTPILAHRGVTVYMHPLPGTEVLATLIPPFAPLNAVGSPPERASILVKHTDIPLCTKRTLGKGQVVLLPFAISQLVETYGLGEQFQLWANLASSLLQDRQGFAMGPVEGIVASCFVKGNQRFVHLVNQVGQRPLRSNLPVMGLSFAVRVPQGATVASVTSRLEEGTLSWTVTNGMVYVDVAVLKLWDMIEITFQ